VIGHFRSLVIGLALAALAGCASAPPSPARIPLPYATPAAFHKAMQALYEDDASFVLPHQDRGLETCTEDALCNRCDPSGI